MRTDPFDDGISNVEMIDKLGDDISVVNAARVSMAKESHWESTWEEPDDIYTLSERDQKLLSYLARHKHWTPFSHPQISLRIKMPIFVARQWFKHMIGFTRNEVSRRYVDDAPEFFVPKEWRKRAESVKQGSSDEVIDDNDKVEVNYTAALKECVLVYEEMLGWGVCPEQARMILPQSMYTEFIETGSLAAYARLCKLRLDPHAQKEIRLYADAVDSIMGELFPYSWKVLMEET